MGLDYAALETLIAHHPGWQLLRHEQAALAASVLDRVFVAANVRALAEADLVEALDDELYELREEFDQDALPKPAIACLEEWAAPARGWLRKFYRRESDEAHYELTPEALQAIAWLGTLADRSFVGTEARVATLIELLERMSEHAESDPARRLEALRQRREVIDAEIARAEAGEVPALDETALRDRLQQFTRMSRELLADFRAVEREFRRSDQRARERLAASEAAAQATPDALLAERRALADSDTGRSLQAAWDRLVARPRHEALTARLARLLAVSAVADTNSEEGTRLAPYDWLEASEHARRTLAELSEQLGRFMRARAWLEKRRITQIVGDIEARAAGLRDRPPAGEVIRIAEATAALEPPAERFSTLTPSATETESLDEAGIDDAASLGGVDRAELARHIEQALQARGPVTLGELIEARPLTHGLAELLGYLQLVHEGFAVSVEEDAAEVIAWDAPAADGWPGRRQASLARIVFGR
ncbi:MAG: DUF3375 domain-containing protein [Betaproteobacteria bacterium]|nr:MAG: DUF3375 domain-containing protein [Betaproteobacteria bacterium]